MIRESLTPCNLSIIIPIYNGVNYIDRCIFSFINSMNVDTELILVNDGSTDQTELYCEQIINKYQTKKIRYVNKKNGGVSSARNLGIEMANGNWIYFLDIDDYLINSEFIFDNTSYEKNIDLIIFRQQLEKNGKFEKINGLEDNLVCQYKENVKEFLIYFQKSYFHECTNRLYRKSIITKYDLKFDTEYRIGEDLIFNLHYLNYSKLVKHKKEVVYVYDIGNRSASTYTLDYQWFSVNFKALDLIKSYFISPKFIDFDSVYSEFSGKFIQTFFRMLIVFDKKNLPIKEKKFITNQLIVVKKKIKSREFKPKNSILVQMVNHQRLVVPIIMLSRRVKITIKNVGNKLSKRDKG